MSRWVGKLVDLGSKTTPESQKVIWLYSTHPPMIYESYNIFLQVELREVEFLQAVKDAYKIRLCDSV